MNGRLAVPYPVVLQMLTPSRTGRSEMVPQTSHNHSPSFLLTHHPCENLTAPYMMTELMNTAMTLTPTITRRSRRGCHGREAVH